MFRMASDASHSFLRRYAMLRRQAVFAATALALLCLLVRGAPAKTDSLAISPAVQRVFPFQVGQQYEFKSSGWFFRPNGDSLAPNTVATITITDTVINGKTYLNIPYWSQFGSEYYRMDDSLRIWHKDLRYQSIEHMLLNPLQLPTLTHGVIVTHWGFQYWCYKTGYAQSGLYTYPMKVYREDYEGWAANGQDSCYEYGVRWDGNRAVYALHGEEGIGTAYHRKLMGEAVHLWGVFRPVSSDPWPSFDTIVSVEASRPEPVGPELTVYPNPFNPSTTICYTLASDCYVCLAVFDIAGQHVRDLGNGYRGEGRHTRAWNGRDETGRPAASGVYFVRLATPTHVVTERVTLLR
jgi:hypothetical protein